MSLIECQIHSVAKYVIFKYIVKIFVTLSENFQCLTLTLKKSELFGLTPKC